MKKTVLVLVVILLLGNIAIAQKPDDHIVSDGLLPKTQTVGILDTVVFDIANAKINGSYIDIPVLFLSSNVITSLDFKMKFNHAVLTYDTIINYKSYLYPTELFNTSDSFLRFTSYSPQQIKNDTELVAIRCSFTGICNLSKTDLDSILVDMNGSICSYKVTSPVSYKPVPKFTVTNGCPGSAANFTDSSTTAAGTITAWKWYFGDGTTATQQNPTHTYTATGTYTVSLKVTSSQGCSDSTAKTVIISSKPLVKFGGDVLSGCTPLLVNFSDSSVTSAGSTYFWNFGDAHTSALKNAVDTYTASGVYTVKHIVTTSSGCSDSLIKANYINIFSTPVAKFTAASGCLGSAAIFTDSSTISSGTITGWKWYFGDGSTSIQQNPAYTYTAAGTHTVSLKVTSSQGCTDSTVKTISITAKPVVKFSADVLSGCAPLIVNFSDSSTTSAGSTYYWNFGDGDTSSLKNAVHTYTASGVYTVEHIVTTSGGCKDSLIKINYINVFSTPVAQFTVANGCLGSAANFTDVSTILSGTINGWKWYFGDGNTSTQQNPSNTYTAAGTYTVSLKVKTPQGCSDSTTKTITITGKPVVKFSANDLSGCAPLLVNFSDSSIAPVSSTYFWNFGDTDTSSLKNTAHTYTASGVYTVKLIVKAPGGCDDSLIKVAYINVFSTPVAKFKSAGVGCVGSAATFTDSSIVSSGTITGWKWYFGDGSTNTQQNPAHTYTATGTYTVSLKVTSSQGCSDSTTKIITITSKPVVKFSADVLSGCAPLLVNFSDSSVTFAGSTYYWNFGDTDTSSLKNVAHTYTATGAYTVKLIVKAPGGCEDSLIKTAYINVGSSATSAYFKASPYVAQLPNAVVSFQNLSSGNNTSWFWNFDDSTFSNQKNPDHIFLDTGIYIVCLKAQSSGGCTSNYCDTITVINPNPVAVPTAFTPNGDNNNDILKVRGGPVSEMDLRIFNEWGNQIFVSNTQSEGWDGSFRGAPQPEGAYVYTLKGKITDNQIINMHGIVNLIR